MESVSVFLPSLQKIYFSLMHVELNLSHVSCSAERHILKAHSYEKGGVMGFVVVAETLRF